MRRCEGVVEKSGHTRQDVEDVDHVESLVKLFFVSVRDECIV